MAKEKAKAVREAMQVVRLKLPVKLVAALEQMARFPFGADEDEDLAALDEHDFPGMVRCALKYAVWKWSQGAGPDVELSGHWNLWDEHLGDSLELEHAARRAAGNPAALERMVGLEPPAYDGGA